MEHAAPAVICLALKYHREPEQALIANTNLGGDNADWGLVLGALPGVQTVRTVFPGAGGIICWNRRRF
jgi:hypothetical protein